MYDSPFETGFKTIEPIKWVIRPLFIATHITWVRMEPDAATVAPQAMSRRF
jgi:hypothetical protein